MEMAKPVMNLYTEATDGSSIETKESALVWHHQDADPGFGSSQAKELLDHLESVLANEPVTAKSGQFIVEVKPQVCSSISFAKPFLKDLCLLTCKSIICAFENTFGILFQCVYKVMLNRRPLDSSLAPS